MVTNGNWASINTNTNTNLPSSVLAASLFLILGWISVIFNDRRGIDLTRFSYDFKEVSWPKLWRSFGTNPAHSTFGDPQVLLIHDKLPPASWKPCAFPRMSRVILRSFSEKNRSVFESHLFLNRDISGVRGHWAEMEHVLECSLRTQPGLTIQFSIN